MGTLNKIIYVCIKINKQLQNTVNLKEFASVKFLL